MDNPEENIEKTANIECENSQELSLSLENNNQFEENAFPVNNIADPLKVVTQSSNSENLISSKTSDIISQNENVVSKTNSAVPTDNSMSPQPLPPLPKDDKGLQPSVPNSADYNMQNYSNYNYMYNYNNYYGYPYPQYQWDYNSQQYYQPYQNYYNYNYNANQAQPSSKPPPPPPDAVQLPVEEKPTSKTNVSTADDSNRYSPTVETDDDDTMKAISESKSDVPIEQLNKLSTNSNHLTTMPSEQIVIQQNMSESVDSVVRQHIIPSITPVQQPVVPVVSQIAPYNIPVQQPSYLITPQTLVKSTEVVELTNQHQNVPALNGKHDSVEKVSKGSTVLGKTQAKKRLMAFSMMKQKMQEQNNSIYDNQNSDIGEGNDVEFVPELNVFQTVTKKKVLTNKKVAKVIKAQQTIEQIEEMKKDEIMQGNNAALYQHFLRSGGNEAPILQKLGIESLAEKYSAKIREQDKRLKRHHHRRRDDNRRSHKYRRRSHSKSRSRSKSRSAEKPKMRALEVKSWKDFINAGFNFDKFRRFKLDETEEIKEKERKTRTKKRQGESRSDGKNQNTESALATETEIGVGDQKLRFNLLDRKKEIIKGLEVLTQLGDYSKYYPSSITRCTKSKPTIKFSENPKSATYHLQNRHQMLATLLPEIESIVHKFLSSMKPKKLKDNPTDDNCNHIDDKLLNMMKDSNIYPFNGWWPKTYFIIYQVKEDPNVEIDKDALVNELATSKRTKKSRFNEDTSMIDLRPTVPSKWDSDYDGSPATDKVMDIEVSQNLKIITSNDSILKQENNPPVMNSQDEKLMDNKSNVSEVVPTTDMISTLPSLCQETKVHAVLDTEYEEFLKIVSVEKSEKAVENNLPITRDIENNLSVKSSTSLNDDSVEDSSIKSSDEFASLHSTEERLINNKSFVNRLASVDLKLKKKKKTSSKKSKKFKKKESKKKKRVSSSSESSQDSESDSDSSSEDSDSETTDSTSSVEKKKSKFKDKKKKKGKANFKKKHKSDKSKTKNSEDEKDNNSSILNLLEKAFNVKIKKKSLDDEDLKHKKKKRKHEKKENKSNDENEDNLEKVKECLKETITQLVKTDKLNKNKSLTSDGNPVSDVFKYFNIDAEKIKKNKKSKKSFKRKHESDNSDEEKTTKKNRLDTSLKIKEGEKKKKSKKKKSSEKRFFDSEEHVSKKKSKKKSKTTDSSDTDDEELEQKKIKNDDDHFFGLRPNEWNIKINNSSMRGVVYQSDVKNLNSTSPTNDISGFDEEVNVKRCINLNKNNQNEVLELPNALVEQRENNSEKESGENKEYKIENDKILITSDNCDDNLFKPKNDILQNTTLSINDNIKEPFLNKDLNNPLKLTQNSVTNTIIKPIREPISYRDKVKMNLKKLSNCQHIPFVFGFSSSLSLLKPTNFKVEKLKLNLKETNEHKKSEVDELTLLKFDRQNVNIRQIPKNKTHVTNIVPPTIGIEVNNKIFDSSFSQEDSEKSTPNSRKYLSDQELNEPIEPSVLNNKLFNTFDSQLNENDSFTNCGVVTKIEEHSFDTTDSSSCGSDSESQNEDTLFDFDNVVVEGNITTSSNSTHVSQFEPQSECNMILPQNTSSIQLTNRDSDAICIKSPNIDLEASIINNELIGQWTSDWSNLNTSVTEYNSSIHQIDDPSELQLKKKSRWDEPPKYDEIDTPKIFTNEQIELKDVLNYSSIDNLENKNIQPKEELISEEQICEINSVVDDTRYYSENWAYETIENDQLIPVDYSIYENYNPNYNCNDEHYNKWKSVDTSDQLTNLAITSENLSTIQVVNVSELPSDNISIDEAEISKGEIDSVKDEATNEILLTVTSDFQDGIVEDEKSNSLLRSEQFFKLYQQHFEHYKQNPIKYSMSEPIIDNITDVNINTLEKLPTQEKFNIDHNDSKTVSIPTQHRAYSCVIEDNDIIVYLTSDNYIAYCAVNDKCMVHIALESISRSGIENEVRHCFNVNQNGSIDEYWLPANLIPFHVSSDAESGVFTDDDVDHGESDSSQEVVDNNDYNVKEKENGNIIDGEWEMIDSISEENVDSWLDDPCILNKYGRNNLENVDHTVTDINREGSMSSSSDYDTDTSDFSDSYFQTKLTKNQNTADAVMVDVIKQSENSDFIVKSDKSTALSIHLDSNIEINNEKGVVEVKQELVTLNNEDNILMKPEEKEKEIKNMEESGFVSVKEEIVFDDISTMDTILSQQNFIKKLNIHTKEANEYSKNIDKHTDTLMVHYSDNMETVKYPFLGLFQPPTISILSQKQITTTSNSKMRKRVTFADGIHPGDNLTASPIHDDNGRPLSPLPLKPLLREVLKLRRNKYPFKKTNVLSKFNMVNKKVATVIPSIKTTSSSVIEYYISRQRPGDLPIIDTFNNSNSVMKSDNSPNSDNTDNDYNKFGRNTTPPRPTRELTPVPSDSECWYDDDNNKDPK